MCRKVKKRKVPREEIRLRRRKGLSTFINSSIEIDSLEVEGELKCCSNTQLRGRDFWGRSLCYNFFWGGGSRVLYKHRIRGVDFSHLG